MRVRRDQGLQLGWFPVALRPPELACVFAVKATFALRHDGALEPLPEGEPLCGDVPSPDGRGGLAYASDFVPFKPRTDVLLRATAHAPNGAAVRYLPVALRVGALTKQLLAVGDRQWQSGLLGRSPGEPAPFTSMPLTWERAFGGPDDRDNPAGVGRAPGAMPNVEWPERLLRSPGDRTPPAGFAPVAATWEPRRSRVGTYGGDYVAKRWPWYPADLEWRHFSSAPDDQQIEGYVRGDEALQFTNLHPRHPELRATLPGLQAHCFATFADGEFRRVELRLDTLFVDLDQERVVLVWRGHTGVRDVRLRDLAAVFATLDALGTHHADAHYRALRDAAPPIDAEEAADAAAAAARMQQFDAAIAAATQQADALEARMDAAALAGEAELAAQEQLLLAQGLDPALLAIPTDVQAAAAADAEVEAALAELRAQRPDLAPPVDAASRAQLGAIDADAPAPDTADDAPPPEPGAWTRERVIGALAAGTGLAGAQLGGLDLSGLDFAGRDLARAALDGASLERSSFAGADLTGATLGGSKLAGADFRDARLDDADFTAATGAGPVFRGASLAGATLEGLQLAGCDFSGCRGRAPSFAGSDLTGCNFRGASLPKAGFGGCTLTGAAFVRADLQAARFGEAKAARIDCTDADLRGLHGGDACDFTGARFRRARLDGANLTGARLDDADLGNASMHRVLLTEASLQRAELSRADLARSVLDAADLRGARLLQANLLYCAMEAVDLAGADLRWANLHGAGLWQTKTDTCDLRNAVVSATLLGR